jgi:Ca2+-binding EF-hand superfamily protein
MPREPVDDDFELTPRELAAGNQNGMSRTELVEACRLFRNRTRKNSGDNPDIHNVALRFEDVDLLLRQLRIFMSMRVLWALLLEIDENVNGQVEVGEFIRMVAKLRGRNAMSPEFHLRSLPRAMHESYVKLFEVMKDENDMIERDDMVSATKKLNAHVNTNAEVFRVAVDDLNVTDNKYGMPDFLVFQAKLRKQKPEIDVALMSLTSEEEERFAALFKEWREKSHAPASPQELRVVLQSIGFNISLEQCRNRLASVELDGSRPIQLKDFLYIVINLGAGSSQNQRPILLPGSSYDEAFKMGFGLEELWELGYDDLLQIKRAGWSVHNVVTAGFAEAWQMRQVGYTAGELRKVGWSCQQLKLAGFSLEELRNAGFSAEVLRECGSVLGSQRAQKAPEGAGLTLRATTNADRPGTSGQGEKRWWGTPRIQAMLEPDNQNNETIQSIMSWG